MPLLQAAGCSEPHVVESVPRLDAEAFRRLLSRPRGLKLIVASHRVEQERDLFLEDCDYAREHLGWRGRPVHLAALCDLFDFPAGRVLLAGVASSGNMIFQRLLQTLLAESEASSHLDNPAAALLSSFALNHWESLRRLFRERLEVPADVTVLGSGTHMRRGQVLFQTDDAYSALSGLPLRSYAWGGGWMATHEPIVRQTLAFYGRQGYEIVYILRNPLDVIVSLAGKMATVVPGERRPHLALDHERWFSDAVETLVRYYEGLAAHADRLTLVRYEALMASPVQEIERLAKAVGVSLPPRRLEEIWRQFDGVPVSGAKHYWDPRAGKWKEHLDVRHRDVVFATRLPELAAELGYRIDQDDFQPERPRAEAPDLSSGDYERMSWIDAILEIPIGKPVSLEGDLARVENRRLGLVGFFDTRHEQQGRDLMASPELETLVRSATWSGRGGRTTTVARLLRPPLIERLLAKAGLQDAA